MKKIGRKKFFELSGIAIMVGLITSFFPFNFFNKKKERKFNININPNAVKRSKVKNGK